jgi:tetratricopeptide (TPR) repeat protein
LAAGYKGAEQVDGGLAAIAEALRLVDKNDERFYEAEVYRIKGELTLQQLKIENVKLTITETPHQAANPQAEAEECFLKAIAIAQRQQAKSLELRAATSLTRLRQQQGQTAEARQMLLEIYNWFTEGFDTKDLREAKELLAELSE